MKTEEDKAAFVSRCNKALFWLDTYADEKFKYAVNKEAVDLDLDDSQLKALAAFKQMLEATDIDAIEAKDLNQKIYDDVIRATEIDGKHFFSAIYRKLINREQGPRLPGFVKELGKERIIKLI